MRDHNHISGEIVSGQDKKQWLLFPCGEDVRDCGKSHNYGVGVAINC